MNKKIIGQMSGIVGILTWVSSTFVSDNFSYFFILFGLLGGYLLGYYSYE